MERTLLRTLSLHSFVRKVGMNTGGSSMHKMARFSFLFLLLIGAAALAANSEKSSVPSGDQKFVKDAAQGGMMEVELGKLAADKASSEDVKAFGKRMVDDHSKANDELLTLAKNKNIALTNTLQGKHKRTMDRLNKETGDKFDRDYMSAMVSDHKEDVSAFQKEADKGHDADVKSWAAKTLPTLKTHLQLAQETEKKLKNAKK
jgi:putative membrane protein